MYVRSWPDRQGQLANMASSCSPWLLLLLVLPLARGQQHLEDKIFGLPGHPNGVAFDMYGGYVTVDDEAGRALDQLLVPRG
jgi:hypothetical protein